MIQNMSCQNYPAVVIHALLIKFVIRFKLDSRMQEMIQLEREMSETIRTILAYNQIK